MIESKTNFKKRFRKVFDARMSGLNQIKTGERGVLIKARFIVLSNEALKLIDKSWLITKHHKNVLWDMGYMVEGSPPELSDKDINVHNTASMLYMNALRELFEGGGR